MSPKFPQTSSVGLFPEPTQYDVRPQASRFLIQLCLGIPGSKIRRLTNNPSQSGSPCCCLLPQRHLESAAIAARGTVCKGLRPTTQNGYYNVAVCGREGQWSSRVVFPSPREEALLSSCQACGLHSPAPLHLGRTTWLILTNEVEVMCVLSRMSG